MSGRNTFRCLHSVTVIYCFLFVQGHFIARYVDLIAYTFIKADRRNMGDKLNYIADHPWVFYQCYKEGHLEVRNPCSITTLHTWQPIFKYHLLSVHRSLSLNITIHKAYVPFTDGCKPHYLAAYEAHHKDVLDYLGNKDAYARPDKHALDYFCGRIHNEMVFTRSNKGIFVINVETNILPRIITVVVSYQPITKLSAFKTTHVSLPSTWNVNIQPEALFFIKQKLQYFWYLSNKIYQNDRHEINLYRWHINVISLRCENPLSHMALYPGLLPWYWTQWRVPPYGTRYCNVRGETSVLLTFHMHATVVLNLHPQERVSLNMTCTLTLLERGEFVSRSGVYQGELLPDMIRPVEQSRFSTLRVVQLDVDSLLFDSFHDLEETSTLTLKYDHLKYSTTGYTSLFGKYIILPAGWFYCLYNHLM